MQELIAFEFDNSVPTSFFTNLENLFSSAFENLCDRLEITLDEVIDSRDEPYTVVISFVEDSECYGGEVTSNQISLNIPDLSNPEFDTSRLERLVVHETTHVIQSYLLKWFPAHVLPKWFSEGMAVALAGQPMIFTREGWLQFKEEAELHLLEAIDDVLFMNKHSKELLGDPRLSMSEQQRINYELGYTFWGTAVAVLISDNQILDDRYAQYDGPFFKPHETLRLKELILKFVENGLYDFNNGISSVCLYKDPIEELRNTLKDCLPTRMQITT